MMRRRPRMQARARARTAGAWLRRRGRGGWRGRAEGGTRAAAFATDRERGGGGGGDGGDGGGRLEGNIDIEDEEGLLQELESRPEVQALLDMLDKEMDKGPEFLERTLRAIVELGGEGDEKEEESGRRPQRGAAADDDDEEEDEEEEDDGTVEKLTPSARLRREFGGELPTREDIKREMFGDTEAEDFGRKFGPRYATHTVPVTHSPTHTRLGPRAS